MDTVVIQNGRVASALETLLAVEAVAELERMLPRPLDVELARRAATEVASLLRARPRVLDFVPQLAMQAVAKAVAA